MPTFFVFPVGSAAKAMATHNMALLTGYLLSNPLIQNYGSEGEDKAFVYIRTMRRDADDVTKQRFEDIMLYYDGDDDIMKRIKNLKRFDLILVKGVLNIIVSDKVHECPICHALNRKENGTFPFIYPLFLRRQDNVANSYEYNSELPDAILANHYMEVSNFLILMGTLVREPELVTKKQNICRYQIAVNRKYFIPSQPDDTADYPWVYSFGEQAQRDMRHLQTGSVVILDGYYHSRSVSVPTVCENCQAEYSYPDSVMDIIPYSVEYLVYKTDEDIAMEEELRARCGVELDESPDDSA